MDHSGPSRGALARLYLVSLAAFLVVDGLWLGVVAHGFYTSRLAHLMAPTTTWPAVIVFYPLFVLAVQVFVVVPGLRTGSLRRTLARAAFFGLVTYATYDLTNLATLRDWPLLVTVVDLAWGAFISTVVALTGFLAGRRLGLVGSR
jgi:uncharacterized membrane protein